MGDTSVAERLAAAIAVALRGDDAGARLVVDLVPASELRAALGHLVIAVGRTAEAMAPGHGDELADTVAGLLVGGLDRG